MFIVNSVISIIYACVAGYMLLSRPNLILFLPWIFGWLIGFPSLILIEDGAYISEQGVSGFTNGATLIYAIYAYSSLFVFYYFADRVVLRPNRKAVHWLFIIATLPFLTAIVFAISQNTSFTRFNIFAVNPVFQKALSYYYSAYIAICIYCFFKEETKWKRFSYLIAAVALELLKGSVFGGIIDIFFIFVAGEVLASKKQSPFRVRFYYLCTCLFIGSVILVYKASMSEDLLVTANRIILQSHLFWGVVNLDATRGGLVFVQELFDHLMSFPENKPTTQYGLGALMYLFSGSLADQFLEDGVRFSGGYPSIFVYYFGIPATVVINLLMSATIAMYIKALLRIVDKYNVLVLIAFYKLANMILLDVYSSGELWNINGKTIILVLISCVLFLIFKPYLYSRHRISFNANRVINAKS